MKGNQTLKYDFLVFVSGSVLLLHCCVHFSVPLDKWILISYEYILYVHIFSFSVGKSMFRDQCTIFWLILMLALPILTFHGVNMFRTSCNLVIMLVLFYGMFFCLYCCYDFFCKISLFCPVFELAQYGTRT